MSETSSSFRDREELLQIKRKLENELHKVTNQFITHEKTHKVQLQLSSQLDNELCTLRSNLIVSGATVLYQYGSAPKRNLIGLKGAPISDTLQQKQLEYEIRQFTNASNLLQQENGALETRCKHLENQLNKLQRWESLSLTELQLEIARWIQEKRTQNLKIEQNAHSASKSYSNTGIHDQN
uniref:AlNc14C69G4798 protein n=1 Tax=Albugo laibachii Nc14 TaxID=890382 RepID=F0WDT0_9STRA|nr:AlNc14C69G4798 [Albugo laibachii Nc14]|eukprot:CCA19357.1 AlNc14C69G4798 [Albugo laibachii Nc14]